MKITVRTHGSMCGKDFCGFSKGEKTHESIWNYSKEKYFTNKEYNYRLLQYVVTRTSQKQHTLSSQGPAEAALSAALSGVGAGAPSSLGDNSQGTTTSLLCHLKICTPKMTTVTNWMISASYSATAPRFTCFVLCFRASDTVETNTRASPSPSPASFLIT